MFNDLTMMRVTSSPPGDRKQYLRQPEVPQRPFFIRVPMAVLPDSLSRFGSVWFILLGVPGMMTYKMINTLDSMIAYRTERYREFGTVAARIDDVANYFPARLTAFLMVMVAGRPHLLRFVIKYGNHHASPNSGYPEAALASILDCRFGGPHKYFGEVFDKPYIGDNDRELTTADMKTAIRVNRMAEILMIALLLAESVLIFTFLHFLKAK